MTLKQRRILIASDDPLGIQVLQYMHAHLGFASKAAQNVDEAIQLLLTGRYDLTYIDFYHSPTAAIHLIQAIRNGDCGAANRNLPIITISDYLRDFRHIEQIQAGADALLGKPVYMEELKLLLSRYVGEQPDRKNR